jgi:hypothetical protein
MHLAVSTCLLILTICTSGINASNEQIFVPGIYTAVFIMIIITILKKLLILNIFLFKGIVSIENIVFFNKEGNLRFVMFSYFIVHSEYIRCSSCEGRTVDNSHQSSKMFPKCIFTSSI